MGRKWLAVFVTLVGLTVIAGLTLPALATPGLVVQSTTSLGRGVTYVRYFDSTTRNVVRLIHIAPGAPITIKAVPAATDGHAVGVALPSTICQRAQALACINGDFFNFQGAPLGGVLVDGVWQRFPSTVQQQVWVNASNQFSIGAQPAAVVYSLGATSYPILLPGRPIALPEHDYFSDGAHARTLVGWNAGGLRLLVTVEQGSGSSGMSLTQAAGLMRKLGATTAVNEDGGGSTQMVVGGALQSLPGYSPRAVSNIWAVV